MVKKEKGPATHMPASFAIVTRVLLHEGIELARCRLGKPTGGNKK